MTTKPENTFIASVHRHLPPADKFYRMKNNNEYTSGVADVWYSGALDLWVEYKFLVLPKRDSTVIDLAGGRDPAVTDLQQAWLRGRHNEGRRVGVIVGCPTGGVWFPGLTYVTAHTVKDFKARMQSRMHLAESILLECFPQ
jgi:hypothetical protein